MWVVDEPQTVCNHTTFIVAAFNTQEVLTISHTASNNDPTQDSKHKGIIKGTLKTRTGETD